MPPSPWSSGYSDACAFCDQGSETADHLLVGCVVSREVWFCSMPLGLSSLSPAVDIALVHWWLRRRLHLQVDVEGSQRLRVACAAGLMDPMEREEL